MERGILEELHLHETQKLVTRGTEPTKAREAADWLIDQMRTAFNDAIVTGWEAPAGTYGLPDPDDEHVVAAAVVGGAGVIVTDNLRHFPTTKVSAPIDVQNAREFAANAVSVDPERATRALTTIARRHRNPRHTTAELLDMLETRYRMSEVAELVRPLLDARTDDG